MPFSIQRKSFDESLWASSVFSGDRSYLAVPKVAETACTWGRLRWPSFSEPQPGFGEERFKDFFEDLTGITVNPEGDLIS